MSVVDQAAGLQASPEQAIDRTHLARMTLGEPSLEREVLALFDRQAEMLMPRICSGARPVAAASAHTLKGSALGIGAFWVARAAAAVEEQSSQSGSDAAITALTAAIIATRSEIARLLRMH